MSCYDRPTDEQIAALRYMVASDEGARVVLAVFMFKPQSVVNELMHEYVESRAVSSGGSR